MKSNSFDVSIPILLILAIVAAWQFYGLAWGGAIGSRSGVELAVGPPSAPHLRATDSLGD